MHMNTTTTTTTSNHKVEVSRTVERLVAGQATSDGAGVKLTRVLTQNLQHWLDPFLMLDAFGSGLPRCGEHCRQGRANAAHGHSGQ